LRLVLGLRDGALVLGPALPQLDGPLQHGGLGAEHPLVLPLGACRRTRSVTSRRVASLWRPLERSGALWRSWRCCDSALNSPRGRFTHRNPCAMRHAPYRVRDATLNGAPFGSAAPQGGFYTKALPDGSTRVTGPANYSGTWLADNGARTASAGRVSAGIGLTPATSAPGLGSPVQTSAPGLGSPRPLLVCAGPLRPYRAAFRQAATAATRWWRWWR
jgi:hypothetical protein